MYIFSKLSRVLHFSVKDNFNDLIHIGFTTHWETYFDLAATWMVFLILSGVVTNAKFHIQFSVQCYQ